jgi:molecular chaperone GrpE
MKKPHDDVMPDDASRDPVAAGGAGAGDAQGVETGQDGAADIRGGDAAAGDDAGALQQELAEQRDKYLRLAAEFDNYRKRSAKERLEATPRAQADVVKQLLDPVDDLMRFADLDPAQVDAKTVVDGVNMVEKKLIKLFAGLGVEVIDPLGQAFDPNHHEAMMTEPAESAGDDDVVSRVFQVGYLFNGQLLRPARVVVKQWNG